LSAKTESTFEYCCSWNSGGNVLWESARLVIRAHSSATDLLRLKSIDTEQIFIYCSSTLLCSLCVRCCIFLRASHIVPCGKLCIRKTRHILTIIMYDKTFFQRLLHTLLYIECCKEHYTFSVYPNIKGIKNVVWLQNSTCMYREYIAGIVVVLFIHFYIHSLCIILRFFCCEYIYST